MSKRLRILGELVGVLVSVASAIYLYTSQQYVVLAVVAVAAGVFAFLLQRDARMPGYTVKSVEYIYDIEDERGKRATVTKKRTLHVNAPNVILAVDRNITASGDIELLPPRSGETQEIVDEGGSKTICTRFPVFLSPGEDFVHEIRYVGLNSLTQSHESVSALATDPCALSITVRFPRERPPKTHRAYEVDSKSGIHDLTDVISRTGTDQLALSVDKARTGHKYVIDWEW